MGTELVLQRSQWNKNSARLHGDPKEGSRETLNRRFHRLAQILGRSSSCSCYGEMGAFFVSCHLGGAVREKAHPVLINSVDGQMDVLNTSII